MTEMMISASSRYFAALGRLDREAYLDCFHKNAVLHDPYGGKPLQGHEGLAKWFVGMERTWKEFSMEPSEQFESGDRIAVQWTAKGKTGSGKVAIFAGINVFTVDENELITRLEGYWDAKSMMAQIG